MLQSFEMDIPLCFGYLWSTFSQFFTYFSNRFAFYHYAAPLVIHTLWCITFTFSTSTLTEYWVNHPACSANWPVMPCYSSRLTIIYSPTFSGSSLLWTYWPFHHIIIIMTTCLSNKPTPTHIDTVINIYIAIN